MYIFKRKGLNHLGHSEHIISSPELSLKHLSVFIARLIVEKTNDKRIKGKKERMNESRFCSIRYCSTGLMKTLSTR